MHAVVVVEGISLLLAHIGADGVRLVQYLLWSDLCHCRLHSTVVVARPAEAVALAVRAGQISEAVEGSATDDVSHLVAVTLHELVALVFVL
jgi:hypothetical protein